MNELPKISLVVPVYQSAKTLERTLKSIADQRYNNLEVIFVDGGSDDGTVEIAQQFSDLFAHFISEPDRGQTDAINKGFRLATGDIFNWLCGDDTLQEGALHCVADVFRANPEANMIVGASRRMYSDGTEEVLPVDPGLIVKIGYRNGIEQPSAFWTSELHRSAGELDESMDIGMDWEWWCRLAKHGANVATTDQELSVYFFPVYSKTSSDPEGNVQAMYRIIREYGPYGGKLADIYIELYREYDLKGCYDKPPTASKLLLAKWWARLQLLHSQYDREIIDAYNWTWCSRQERGLTLAG